MNNARGALPHHQMSLRAKRGTVRLPFFTSLLRVWLRLRRIMASPHRLFGASLCAATLYGGAAWSGPPGTPELPAIIRSVSPIESNAFTAPHIPPHHTSADGRVALNINAGHHQFYLFAPEKLKQHVTQTAPGVHITSSPRAYPVNKSLFHRSSRTGQLSYNALCEPHSQVPGNAQKNNPRACGGDTSRDCYDLTVVSAFESEYGSELWGTPVTVEVESPKTAIARIRDGPHRHPSKGRDATDPILFRADGDPGWASARGAGRSSGPDFVEGCRGRAEDWILQHRLPP